MVFAIGSQSSSVWVWLGPVLLFIASMITVFWTNRAADKRAKKDRENADNRAREDRQNERERDFRLWQRDTLLRVAEEIIQATTDLPDASDDPYLLEPSGKFALNVQRLSLIGAREAAARCAELHEALTEAVKVAESEAPYQELRPVMNDYEKARAAFVEAVQRDLARTSQPGITPVPRQR